MSNNKEYWYTPPENFGTYPEIQKQKKLPQQEKRKKLAHGSRWKIILIIVVVVIVLCASIGGLVYFFLNNSSGVPKYTVNLEKGTGIVSVKGNGRYEEGEIVTVTATSASGYDFNDWISSNTSLVPNSSNERYTFEMPVGDITLTANAEKSAPAIAEGECGEKVYWKLDQNGILKITGTGPMKDYPSRISSNHWRSLKESTAPWCKETWDEDRLSKVEKIKISDGITHIGDWAFTNCYNATEITIPQTVTSIGDYALMGCKKLKNIQIPDSVNDMGIGALANCYALTEINLPKDLTTISGALFSNCDKLTNVEWPNHITAIEDEAFSDCHNLTNITIPEGVNTIGNSAFEHCIRLTTIILPSTITSIGNNCFLSCANIKEIHIPSSVTSMGNAVFEYWDSSHTIYIEGKSSAPPSWDEAWLSGAWGVNVVWDA